MNRVWTALLLLAALVVAGAVGYVLVHNDKVPQAGQTPGYLASTPAARGSGSASESTSGVSSTTTATDKASTSSSPGSVSITFLGDNWSTGAGVNHRPSKAFPDLTAAALKVKDKVVANDGSGYAKKGPAGKNYLDLVSQVVASKPDIVVVTGGRNDVSDDVNTLGTAAKNLFATLKTRLPDAKLVAVAPFWGDSDHPSDLGKVDSAVKSGVQAAGGTYLDLPDPLRHHGNWMADSANPDEKGNQAIADALHAQLQKLI